MNYIYIIFYNTLYCTMWYIIIIIKQSINVSGFSAKLFIALQKELYEIYCTVIEQSDWSNQVSGHGTTCIIQLCLVVSVMQLSIIPSNLTVVVSAGPSS